LNSRIQHIICVYVICFLPMRWVVRQAAAYNHQSSSRHCVQVATYEILCTCQNLHWQCIIVLASHEEYFQVVLTLITVWMHNAVMCVLLLCNGNGYTINRKRISWMSHLGLRMNELLTLKLMHQDACKVCMLLKQYKSETIYKCVTRSIRLE